MVNGKTFLALDVGERRIGVAKSQPGMRLVTPLVTLENNQTVFQEVAALSLKEQATAVVVGLPRNLTGDDTPQTALVRQFVDELKATLSVPVHFQDEALTSRKAVAELEGRAKPYRKEEVDALAACYILEDFMEGQPGDYNV